jgi:hypothetical protein
MKETSAFIDNSAVPLPGLPLVDVCPRAGVINPIAYNAIEADKSLVQENISPGDLIYLLSTADVSDGDLAAVKTPDGIYVRIVKWVAREPSGKLEIHLEAANPEISEMIYEYDDTRVRTRWRAVWICRHGDHSRCGDYKQQARVVC